MSKKLTIQVSDEFYDGLQRRVGKRGIGRFLEEIARPHVIRPNPATPGGRIGWRKNTGKRQPRRPRTRNTPPKCVAGWKPGWTKVSRDWDEWRRRYGDWKQKMRRGDVWWAALEPAVGGEIGKTRPAVIISNDRSNAQNNRVQIVPVTSQTRRVYPSEALVTVDGGLSKAVADQIRTLDKSRLLAFMGRISDTEMRAVEDAVRLQLGLD